MRAYFGGLGRSCHFGADALYIPGFLRTQALELIDVLDGVIHELGAPVLAVCLGSIAEGWMPEATSYNGDAASVAAANAKRPNLWLDMNVQYSWSNPLQALQALPNSWDAAHPVKLSNEVLLGAAIQLMAQCTAVCERL